MQNVVVKVEGSKMIIEVDLSTPTTPSASGKTNILASSKGNQKFATPDGQEIFVGLNVYKKR